MRGLKKKNKVTHRRELHHFQHCTLMGKKKENLQKFQHYTDLGSSTLEAGSLKKHMSG